MPETSRKKTQAKRGRTSIAMSAFLARVEDYEDASPTAAEWFKFSESERELFRAWVDQRYKGETSRRERIENDKREGIMVDSRLIAQQSAKASSKAVQTTIRIVSEQLPDSLFGLETKDEMQEVAREHAARVVEEIHRSFDELTMIDAYEDAADTQES